MSLPSIYKPLVISGVLVLLAFASNVTHAQLDLSSTNIAFLDTNVGSFSVFVIEVTNTTSTAQTFNYHVIPASCPFTFGEPTPPCLESTAAVEELGSFQPISLCVLILPGQTCDLTIYFQPTAARTLAATFVFLDTSVSPPRVLTRGTLTGTGVPVPLTGGTVRAIEYYNTKLDHYFFTPLEDEIKKLDSRYFSGWQRTGYSYWVWPSGTGPAGGNPVCRFYGLPQAGLDSHFYSASPDECQAVISRFSSSWELETPELFDALLPDQTTGTCSGSMVPLHRLYNNRRDANHRYMVRTDSQWDALVAKGWIPEGYGAGTVMCLPPAMYTVQ
jgi:hypothetical protein